MRARRQELDLVGRDIESGGISTSVLSLIENARKDRYETRLLRRLAATLAWTPDSIDRILRGEPPLEQPLDRRAPDAAPAGLEGKVRRLSPAQRAKIEALVDEMLPGDN